MAWFFSITLFCSSALLFLVQPLCGKLLLPALGGSAAVWTTCVLFFQAVLLAGYGYAHAGSRTIRWHALLHVGLLAAALAVLPFDFAAADPPETGHVFWLLAVLIIGVGFPFFVLSASGPLLQRWFAATTHPYRDNPYFLYAASNLGSLVALIGYPFLIEPNFSLEEQRVYWKWLFGGVVILSADCALILWRQRRQQPLKIDSTVESAPAADVADDPQRHRYHAIYWILLAFVPSSLMLSVTAYLTTDIASIPLLWVIPLALYLLSFVIAFARPSTNSSGPFTRWTPLAALVVVLALLLQPREPVVLIVAVHLLALFWLATMCHGQLARTRPPAQQLTGFYLWIAVGGVLGGVFNTLAAPVIFNEIAEYPLLIVAACLLCPSKEKFTLRAVLIAAVVAVLLGITTAVLIWFVQTHKILPAGNLSVGVMFAGPLLAAYLMHASSLRFGLSLAAILLASLTYHGLHGRPIHVQRSFFGVHRVTENEEFRFLSHGNTRHGQQSRDPRDRRTPLVYYFPTSPIGQVVAQLKGDERLQRVGLVGLGSGAMAAYARPGQHWTFFEIDPAVIHIARDSGLFTYLADSPGKCDVQAGDGRLLLKKSAERFGLLVIDAFSSDSIPLHLLTREAFAVYRDRLLENGVLAVHISNHYLDLKPVLASLAADAGPEWLCLFQDDRDVDYSEEKRGKAPSQWLIITKDHTLAGTLATRGPWVRVHADPSFRVWTDDYSNLLSVFRWRDADGKEK